MGMILIAACDSSEQQADDPVQTGEGVIEENETENQPDPEPGDVGDPEPEPEDTDGDGVPDADDNCPAISNANQQDSDGNGVGDACTPVQYDVDDSLFMSVFPDGSLRACLDSWTEGNGWTYADEVSGEQFVCIGLNINELTGIENLKSLTNLNFSSNEIADVSPVTSLSNLRKLYLHRNNIVDVSPLSSLGNLTHLSLSYNQITSDNDGDATNGVGALSALESADIYLDGNPGMDCAELEYLISSGANVISPSVEAGVTCDNP